MKSPVELFLYPVELFLYHLVCYIMIRQTPHWTTCKRGLYVKSYCFFETIAQRFKNYKQIIATGSLQPKLFVVLYVRANYTRRIDYAPFL